jgi:hypothetical protein
MGASENGGIRGKTSTNGTGHAPAADRPTCPRRLVLLKGGEHSAVERVLTEFTGAEGRGKDAHAAIETVAAQHAGKVVAAEWLGPRGWTRFLWCRKGGQGG